MANNGKRFNSGKVKLNLVPTYAIEAIARVLTWGADHKKYGPWNWAEGLVWSEIIDSLERHLHAFREGGSCDEESGEPHLAHALTNLMFLYMHERFGLGVDDRVKFSASSGYCPAKSPQAESIRFESVRTCIELESDSNRPPYKKCYSLYGGEDSVVETQRSSGEHNV